MTFFTHDIQLLIIEDNPGDYCLIKEYIDEQLRNPVIRHVLNFAQAKDLLQREIQFDAILLDLSLPDLSGTALVEEMIALSGIIPIIVLTGIVDKEFGIKTLSMGVLDYLLKDELNGPQLIRSIFYSIERKKINIKLHSSEENYRNLFQYSPQPMWVFDLESLYFVHVNDAAVNHYGFTNAEFLGMTIRDIIPTNDIAAFEDIIESHKMNLAYFTALVHHVRKDGKLIHVDIQSNPIIYNGRKARLVLATDISDRMQYIKAIEEQNKKLQEIAWIQSHVVRAPLARLMGTIEVLKHQNQDIPANALFDSILSSADELDGVLREIVKKSEQVKNNPSDETQCSNYR